MNVSRSIRPPLLSVTDLRVSIPTRAGKLVPVDGVNLDVNPGESLGIIGESGSGKTTLARAVLGDLPTRAGIEQGRVIFAGTDLADCSRGDLDRIRISGMAMVHQQAGMALNPVLTLGEQLTEVPIFQFGAPPDEARTLVMEALRRAQIRDPQRIMASYPHQVSGGQLQRVVIAMALLSRPRLLVLDEPTTGLDATVQAGILQLVAALRQAGDLAVVYISHDLSVAAQVCDRLAVLYAGQIVETGKTASVLGAPLHPYTRGLVRSLPSLAHTKHDSALRPIPGKPPQPLEGSVGCRFADRCEHAEAACRVIDIELHRTAVGDDVRCRRWTQLPSEASAPPPVSQKPVVRRPGVLLSIRDLRKTYRRQGLFSRRALPFAANQGISLDIGYNEIFAIVGESGSGKSTLARIVVGLERRRRDGLTSTARRWRICLWQDDPRLCAGPSRWYRRIRTIRSIRVMTFPGRSGGRCASCACPFPET